MTAPDSTQAISPSSAESGRQRRGLGIVYPMRVLGATLPIVTTVLYVRQFSSFSWYHYVFIALLLVHPHLFFFLGRKYDSARAKIDSWALLVDAFYLGLAAHVLGFSTMPTLVMTGVALANGLGIRGFRHMLLCGIALVAGMTAPMLFVGIHFDPQRSLPINLVCGGFFFIYFLLFAWAAYNRASLLKWTRRELQEQKRIVEIEKRRSDLLMHSIGPDKMVDLLRRDGSLEPTRFESVTLLCIDFRDFSRAVERHDPRQLLDFLTYCFKAFDAITTRHGLERLKTMADIFIGTRGIPDLDTDDATVSLAAALEIRDFLADLESSRKANETFHLDARIAVHRGDVLGGLVEAPRLSYDVWGAAIDTLLRIERQGSPGQVIVSDAVRQAASGAFTFSAAGSLRTPADTEVSLFNVERVSDR